MSCLLVIGNGFDISAGLKSSYKDCFESEYYSDTLKKVRTFVSLVKSGGSISLEPINEFNCWDILFYLMTYENNKRPLDYNINCEIKWCDVEEVIHDSLFSPDVINFNWDDIQSTIHQIYRRNDPNRTHEIINREPLYNKAIIQYSIKKISGELDARLDLFNRQCFYEWLLDELKAFEEKFGTYIDELQDSINYNNRADKIVKILVGSHGDYEIDSFNYSYFTTEGRKDINHINGEVTFPIFGISNTDFDIIDNQDKIMFTKTQRRINQDANNTIQYESRSNTDYVVVFGHSLNRQDYDYFSYIFTLLKFNTFDTDKMGTIEFKFYIYDDARRAEICSTLSKSVHNLIEYYEKNACGRDSSVLTNLLRFSGKLKITEVEIE